MPRQAAPVRVASAARVRGLITMVRAALPAHARTSAEVVAGTLVGTLQLARALGNTDDGRAILAAARASLVNHYDQAPPNER